MKKKRKYTRRAGLPPGSLVFVGEKRVDKVHINIIDYNESNLTETSDIEPEDLNPCGDSGLRRWTHVSGIHDDDAIKKIGEVYGIHPLTLEDIMNTDQRAKIEFYDNYIFTVLKNICGDIESGLEPEQISFVLGNNFIISFSENGVDIFDEVRQRLLKNSLIKSRGTDYLNYALIDLIVDNYFDVLEKIDDEIEQIEDELIRYPSKQTLGRIYNLKQNLILIYKSIMPVRELARKLEMHLSPLIKTDTDIYLKDLYDHIIQVIETIETSREMASSMLDIYLSSASNKLNEVMKVLTIIATIFIPLTFIAGLYGMNFKFMPELEWKFGYPFALILMFGVSMTMLFYFKKKNWF